VCGLVVVLLWVVLLLLLRVLLWVLLWVLLEAVTATAPAPSPVVLHGWARCEIRHPSRKRRVIHIAWHEKGCDV
jgi:hypothetical protein